MVDVYYPYFQRAAKWHELKYSLRSIEKHFKFDFQVWIVGDLPDWIKNVRHIPHDRCHGMPENTTYDAITKLLLFLNNPEAKCCFIRMYDDMYLLKDVSLDDISVPKYMPGPIPNLKTTWISQLNRTIDAVKKRGYPGINTETHLPERFDTDMMKEVISSYSAIKNRLLTSTLYHNTFFKADELVPINKEMAVQFYDNRDGVIKVSNVGDIAGKCENRTYLNHNNGGLNVFIQRFIANKFPCKSSFEK
jgi:hypothetical protein